MTSTPTIRTQGNHPMSEEVKHRHAPEDLLQAFDRENGFVGVVFKCGCTATYTADGKALTGGESIRDIPQDVLRAKINTPASCSPDVEALVGRAHRYRRDNLPNYTIGYKLMGELADALETMMREKDVMREALYVISELDGPNKAETVRQIHNRARAALDMTLDKGR